MNNSSVPMTPQEERLLQQVLKQQAMHCKRCKQPIEELDCYCRHCGKPLRPFMGFWYDHGGILLCTLIAGPVSLLPLWLSRKLSITAKCAWSVGIGLFSAYLLYMLYQSYLLVSQAFSAVLSSAI